MNKDKYVFAQMVEFLDNYKFLRIVKKYDGNKYVKHFTSWNQFLTLMFGHLSVFMAVPAVSASESKSHIGYSTSKTILWCDIAF